MQYLQSLILKYLGLSSCPSFDELFFEKKSAELSQERFKIQLSIIAEKIRFLNIFEMHSQTHLISVRAIPTFSNAFCLIVFLSYHHPITHICIHFSGGFLEGSR